MSLRGRRGRQCPIAARLIAQGEPHDGGTARPASGEPSALVFRRSEAPNSVNHISVRISRDRVSCPKTTQITASLSGGGCVTWCGCRGKWARFYPASGARAGTRQFASAENFLSNSVSNLVAASTEAVSSVLIRSRGPAARLHNAQLSLLSRVLSGSGGIWENHDIIPD
jgi:hypothetical protein